MITASVIQGKALPPEFTHSLNEVVQFLRKHHLAGSTSTHTYLISLDSIISQIFVDIFSFMDAQLFNTLIRQPALFTAVCDLLSIIE